MTLDVGGAIPPGGFGPTYSTGMAPHPSKDARTAPPGGDPDSILVEAQNLVHGPRQASYGHPSDDFQRTADLLNVLSKRGRAWLPSDVALVMMCVKLSRQANAYKRDNLVDLCGYAECWARIVEGR